MQSQISGMQYPTMLNLYHQVEGLLAKYYGIEAIHFKRLLGYQNLNILVKVDLALESRSNIDSDHQQYLSSKKSFIVKLLKNISNQQRQILASQVRILLNLFKSRKRMQNCQPGMYICQYPLPVPCMDGQYLKSVEIQQQIWTIRVLTFIQGQTAGKQPVTKTYMSSLARQITYLSNFLIDFHQKALDNRGLQFQIQYFLQPSTYNQRIRFLQSDESNLVLTVISHIEKFLHSLSAPAFKLRKSIIHGDLNPENIVVENNQVLGFFDFTDICESFLVAELSTAVAYICLSVLSGQQIKQALVYMVVKYSQNIPLFAQQIELYYWLVQGRLCMSISNAAYNYSKSPKNDYIVVDKPQALKTLQVFSQFNHPDIIQGIIKQVKQNNGLINLSCLCPSQLVEGACKIFINLYAPDSEIISARRLQGYETQNYYIETLHGQFVLKIESIQNIFNFSKLHESVGIMLEFISQNVDMRVDHQISLKMLEYIKLSSGQFTKIYYNDKRKIRIMVRAYKYLKGKTIITYMQIMDLRTQSGRTKRMELIRQLGKAIAKMNKVFLEYNDPIFCEIREEEWILGCFQNWQNNLEYIKDFQIRGVSQKLVNLFKKNIESNQKRLRKAIIHGDITNNNILINTRNQAHQIQIIFIDYQSVTYSYIIEDIACLICHCLYLNPQYSISVEQNTRLFQQQMIQAICSFHQILPLSSQEAESIIYFVGARFAMIMGNISKDMLFDPDNKHISKNQQEYTLSYFKYINFQQFNTKLSCKLFK